MTPKHSCSDWSGGRGSLKPFLGSFLSTHSLYTDLCKVPSKTLLWNLDLPRTQLANPRGISPGPGKWSYLQSSVWLCNIWVISRFSAFTDITFITQSQTFVYWVLKGLIFCATCCTPQLTENGSDHFEAICSMHLLLFTRISVSVVRHLKE